jgi:GNAT superfamily N-acetyltransferase
LDVRQASIADLDALTPLFDGYRQFYRRTSDPVACRIFLAERFARQESVVFLACAGQHPVGFAQLYPSFSSVRLSRTFILNDLFVADDARGSGAGAALLAAACAYGRQVGAARLTLSTAVDNSAAQALYERCGWTRDIQFRTYGIALPELAGEPA